MKKSLMALVAATLLVPGMARAQMFTATVTGQASGFISPGDQLGGEYGGIVYAGTADGITPLFVTRCDYGFNWNPDTNACDGVRGGIAYQTATVATGATSASDGAANTAILGARADAPAGKYCADLAPPNVNSHGYSDWYLPATGELAIVRTNYAAIGNFVAAYYWASTEYNPSYAYVGYIGGGSITYDGKTTGHYLRCMRKGN